MNYNVNKPVAACKGQTENDVISDQQSETEINGLEAIKVAVIGAKYFEEIVNPTNKLLILKYRGKELQKVITHFSRNKHSIKSLMNNAINRRLGQLNLFSNDQFIHFVCSVERCLWEFLSEQNKNDKLYYFKL